MENETKQETKEINFKIGDKYTLISVSDMMATTFRHEITITQQDENGRFIFKHKGKRKLFYLNYNKDSTLIFKGWEIPLSLDSEIVIKDGDMTCRRFCGNALLNLVCESEKETRHFIDKFNLNGDLDKGIITIKTLKEHKEKQEYDGKPLYLDDAKATRQNHGVMDRILTTLEKKESEVIAK